MKKFLLNLLIFGTIFFLFDKIFLLLISYVPRLEVDKRLEDLLNGNVNKELVVLGSSRGARNVIAGQIEEKTGISSFNLSYPGGDITFKEFILRTLIAYNQIPDIVLLVVDHPRELLHENTTYFRLDRLYPLIKYEYIRQELIRRGEKNAILSKLFVLNRMNISNFDLRRKEFTKLDSMLSCGSMPVALHRNDIDWAFRTYEDNYESASEVAEKVTAFNEIVRQCKDNNIKLVILFAPNYTSRHPSFENRIRGLAGKNALYMYYDEYKSIYKDTTYFYDKYHMRKNGAVEYTGEIVEFLNINRENLPEKLDSFLFAK